jgi:transposase
VKDLDNSVRGLLRGFGLRLPTGRRGQWSARVRERIEGNPMLTEAIEPILLARDALARQFDRLDKRVRDVARDDATCRRLMTVPGVGAIVAMTFRAAVDDPARFRSSKSVGACFGLTPRRYQSGETDRSGSITKAGDASVRAALFEAAHVMMVRVVRWTPLKAWAMRIAARRGAKRAKVALARKLAVIQALNHGASSIVSHFFGNLHNVSTAEKKALPRRARENRPLTDYRRYPIGHLY